VVSPKEKAHMCEFIDEQIERWTAKRKSVLVPVIIQGKTSVAEASKAHHLQFSEIEAWVGDGKRGMENALHSDAQDIRDQYEPQPKDLLGSYGEAMLERRARKELQSLVARHK
jgi:hypothetical protein